MNDLDWTNYDADKPNPQSDMFIKQHIRIALLENRIETGNRSAIHGFAENILSGYKKGTKYELNQTLAVDIFRPSEFENIDDNDSSLTELIRYLSKTTFDWHKGTQAIVVKLREHFKQKPIPGVTKIAGANESVTLDVLVKIRNREVAIEVEESTNIDNGYFTLKQAVADKIADYGVMIVPWTEKAKGRAQQRMALGRLDREFNGITDLSRGPIYRIGILRLIDIYKLMLKL